MIFSGKSTNPDESQGNMLLFFSSSSRSGPIQVVSSVCDIFQGNRSFAEHVMSFSEIFKRARVYGAGINHPLFAQMDSDAVLICGPAKLDG